MSTAPACPYCGRPATAATAEEVYGPERSRGFRDARFWRCIPCEAYVGCHPGTDVALGTPAKEPLRKLRSQVHARLDPLWRTQARRGKARGEAYAFLARALGISAGECHVGLFDEARCLLALSRLQGVTMESIRAESARTRYEEP